MRKYTTKEAVALMASWGVPFSPGTLEVWRCHKEGPEFIKIRSRVFYTEQALKDFVRGSQVKTVDSVRPERA